MKELEKELILVDEADREIGTMAKSAVHEQGLLHRAFSVFIFNNIGELLLQQRADNKYHSGGLWTNTCCSHPQKGENTEQAANNRLMEEMGIRCKLIPMFSFIYKAEFENGLIENEFDHVFFGFTDAIPEINKKEVKNWKYVKLKDLENDIKLNPEDYTVWLKICFPKIIGNYNISKNAFI